MGCVSSKLFVKDIKQDILHEKNGDECPNHVVSLTSSTIGLLKLEKEIHQEEQNQPGEELTVKECVLEVKKKSPPREEAEVINAWELMEGLEEEAAPVKRSPRSRVFRLGFGDLDAKTPLKVLSQAGFSPRKLRRSGGKENKVRVNGSAKTEYSPSGVLRPRNSIDSPWRLRIFKIGSPNEAKCDNLRVDSGLISSRRKSLSPLFDPELAPSFEKELSDKEEQVKKMGSTALISRKGWNSKDPETILATFESKCPPGGEKSVVIYTTTLRGIRKTFEDCNTARSIIQSHNVQMFERDVSMHSGFKEELRRLMGSKDVKVPLVFVKGRLIGGADEMVKLEEEGKLGILFSGMATAAAICEGCGDIRFIMCRECNGSSKLLGEDGKKSVKCRECNENGLIQCPICC